MPEGRDQPGAMNCRHGDNGFLSDVVPARMQPGPWPPPLAVMSRKNLADAKAKVLELEAERDKLGCGEEKSSRPSVA